MATSPSAPAWRNRRTAALADPAATGAAAPARPLPAGVAAGAAPAGRSRRWTEAARSAPPPSPCDGQGGPDPDGEPEHARPRPRGAVGGDPGVRRTRARRNLLGSSDERFGTGRRRARARSAGRRTHPAGCLSSCPVRPHAGTDCPRRRNWHSSICCTLIQLKVSYPRYTRNRSRGDRVDQWGGSSSGSYRGVRSVLDLGVTLTACCQGRGHPQRSATMRRPS